MAKVFGHGDTGQSTKVSESDITIKGTTPTLTVGDGGAEDTKIIFDGNAKDFYVGLDDTVDKLIIGVGSTVGTNSILTMTDDTLTIGDGEAVDTKIVFDGNAQDYYIGIDDGTDDLMIGLGSTMGTTPALSIDENLNVKTYADITMTGTTPTLTIGDAGAEDTSIVFDGNAHDFQIMLDDSEDQLQFQVDSSAKAILHSDVLVGLDSGNATQTPGFGYLPNYITWSTTADLTLTPAQSGSTIVMTNAGGDVILPEGGTVNYGMQFVVINATTSNNANAVQRSGSTDSFYDSDTTGGETSAQAIAAMKAKTFIYFKENGWLVIG
jgi:hypothetical protein